MKLSTSLLGPKRKIMDMAKIIQKYFPNIKINTKKGINLCQLEGLCQLIKQKN